MADPLEGSDIGCVLESRSTNIFRGDAVRSVSG